MTAIARCNNVVLLASGRDVRLVDQGMSGLPTARFVTAGLGVIMGINGVANSALPVDARVLMVALGALFGAAAVWLYREGRARADRSKRGVTIATFDLDGGLLRDVNGRVLAPLAEVRLLRTLQLASSSRALAVSHPSFGRLVLARGNPFGDSVDELEEALVARGLRRSDGT